MIAVFSEHANKVIPFTFLFVVKTEEAEPECEVNNFIFLLQRNRKYS